MKNTLSLRVSGLFLIILCSQLSGCLTTEEFYAASELNRADDDMQQLLKTDNLVANSAEIAGLADYSMAKAGNLNAQGHSNLAIGFYRIAATGYWKDQIDNDENNAAFFNSINSAQIICNEMAEKAPDRDCFFLAYVPMLATVEESLKNENLRGFTAAESDASVVQAVRDFVKNLSRETNTAIDASNGGLTNLINLANQQASFLNEHGSMASYICRNIKNVTAEYITTVATLTKVASLSDADITAENPLFQKYLSGSYPDSANTIAKQTDLFVNSMVSACN